jgi:transposase
MSEELRNEIVRRWRDGASQRSICEALGVSRGRVARVLAKHRAARSGQAAACAKRPSLLDPFATLIDELLARYPRT